MVEGVVCEGGREGKPKMKEEKRLLLERVASSSWDRACGLSDGLVPQGTITTTAWMIICSLIRDLLSTPCAWGPPGS